MSIYDIIRFLKVSPFAIVVVLWVILSFPIGASLKLVELWNNYWMDRRESRS